MEIISRKDALAIGLKRYFTGAPCRKGHISEMHVDEGCLVCKAERSAQYNEINKEHIKKNGAIYRENNQDKIRAKNASWYERNREKDLIKSAGWRAKNEAAQIEWRIKNKERLQAWRDGNRDKARDAARAWRILHPDVTRIYKQNRRAHVGSDRLSAGIAKKLYKIQKGKCVCCKRPLGSNYHVDHIIPLARGGRNIDSNVQLLRQRCNSQKGAKHPVDFMQSRGFLI